MTSLDPTGTHHLSDSSVVGVAERQVLDAQDAVEELQSVKRSEVTTAVDDGILPRAPSRLSIQPSLV